MRHAATEWVKPRPEKDSQDWYFFVHGREFKKMLGLLSQLLGPIPMIPRYVLGAWVSSRAAYSADEWKMIANRFREESVPMEMIGLDSPSTTKVVWSGYDTDPEQFPDPKEFFPWMLERGFRTFFNEHYAPLTRESDSNFEAIRQLMGLPPDTEEIPHDLASKKYSRAFMDLLHKPLLDMGIAFWWQDGNAPANMPGLDPEMWTRHAMAVILRGICFLTGSRWSY